MLKQFQNYKKAGHVFEFSLLECDLQYQNPSDFGQLFYYFTIKLRYDLSSKDIFSLLFIFVCMFSLIASGSVSRT